MTEGRSQVLKALSGLLVALFTATLSSTVVSTALPRMISDLGGSQAQYTWVVTATLLTATATTPIWGKLADLFSKKTLVQVAIGVFVAGSLASGLSQDAGQLIAARALQGAGVGGLQTLVQIAIAAMIPPRERGRYSGYLSSVTAVSTIGGPLLGGLVVDTPWLGWRWCFFIGVPVAIAALVLLQVTLNLPVVRRERVRVDYAGAALITAGVCLLLVWVSFVGDAFTWSSWPSLAVAGGSVLLLGAAVRVETKVPEPVVPLDIVRQRPTALAILGSLAAGTAMYGAAVFLSQYFQVSRGRTPTEAGLLTIPMMAGILVASTVVGRLVTRTGKLKPYLVAGSISLTAGFAALGFLDRETPLVVLSVAMALVGAGIGMTMQNFVLVVQNAVPLKDIGAASSAVSFFRSLGGTIGVAVLGAVLARDVAANPGDVPTAYGEATAQVFLISAAVAAVGVLAAVMLKPVVLRTSLDVVKEVEKA
ncbi:MDR family MFS transporter [Actinosynnema pretiosum]|uniref:EmrB/QacA family drug resistance transporter n=1 Tax=Actinosynnema pretiosum TaxID=42197 RepID=A0A290ZAG8_9PSEU|nr:MDR family MFS transporter [Actinosynnema pretiosum]ATE55969.1 EmrB/QacA family drug resistance transporter [Actinosynnema pretiosum]